MVEKRVSVRFTADGGREVKAEAEGIRLAIGQTYTNIERQTKSASDSADLFAAALDREASAFDSVRAAVDPVFAAQKRYETQVANINAAVRSGTRSQREANDVLALAKRQYEAAGAATRALDFDRLSTGARRSRIDFQNVSYQVQDFAVQVGSGTAATVALGQQLPQLLSGFGAFGAVLGTVAAVALPMAGYFFSMGKAADEAKGQVGDLTSVVDAYRDAVQAASQTPFDLAEEYGIALGQAQELLDTRRQLARLDAERALTTEIVRADDATGRFAVTYGTDDLARLDQALATLREIQAATERVAAIEVGGVGPDEVAEYDALIARLTDLRGVMDGSQAVTDELLGSISGLAESMGVTVAEATGLARALAAVNDATSPQSQVDAWKAVADALLEASGGVSGLTEEGRKLYDAANAAQTELLRIAQLDLTAAQAATTDFASRWSMVTDEIAKARGETTLLGVSIADALAPLKEAQGWAQSLWNGLGEMGRNASGPLAVDLAGASSGATAAAQLLRALENPNGPWLTPQMDRKSNGEPDRLRIGYSSDTVTLEDGSFRDVVAGMRVSVEEANRDLERRIRVGQAEIINAIGPDQWAKLLPAQQAVLSSLEYNYGTLPDQIAQAIKAGATDNEVAMAIRRLPANPERRQQESDIYLGANMVGAEPAALRQEAEAAREAAEATREAEQARKDAARQAEQDAEAYDRYAASTNEGAAAQREYAEAVRTITAARDAEHISAGVANARLEEARLRLEEANRAIAAGRDESLAFQAALDAAGMSAADLGQAKAGILIGGVDGVANAFGDLVGGGLRDWKGFWGSLGSVAKTGLSQLVSMFARNKLVVPIQAYFSGGSAGGIAGAAPGASGPLSGLLGGISGAAGGFASGMGNVASGLLSGGLGGAGSALTAALGGATSGLTGLATAAGALALPVAGAVAAFKFFTGSTKELDRGIRVTLDGLDVAVEQFSKEQRTRFFGLSKSTDTDYGVAHDSVAGPIQANLRAMQASAVDAGKVLGKSAADFAGFSASFQVSTKGMDAEQAAAAVQQALAGVSEGLASEALRGVRDLRRAGESWVDALTRVTSGVDAARQAMWDLERKQLGTSEGGTRQAVAFSDALGGPAAMQAAVRAYVSEFYTAGEQVRNAAQDLRRGFDAAGIDASIPKTEKEFRGLVDRLLDTGRAADAATVIGLAPLWQEMQRLKEEGKGAAEVVADFTDQQASIRERIWQATGDTEKMREAELASLGGDSKSIWLLRKLWGVEDAAKVREEAERAAAEMASKAEAMADQRAGLQAQIDQAMGNEAAIRAEAIKKLGGDKVSVALLKKLWGVEAANEAKAAAEAVAEESKSLDRRLLEVQGNKAALLELEVAGYDKANQAKARYVLGLEAIKAATEAIDPTNFVSFLDFQRAQVRAATPIMAPTMPALTLPSVTAGGKGAAQAQEALLAEVKALRRVVEEQGSALASIEDSNYRGYREVRALNRRDEKRDREAAAA